MAKFLPKEWIKRALRRFGYDVVKLRAPEDLELTTPAQQEMMRRVAPFTATSPERVLSLLEAIDYLVSARIPGAIVECGVYKGGSMMAAALALQARGDTSRELYLYDTFDGMSPPSERDTDNDGVPVADLLAAEKKDTGIWCYAGLPEVQANMASTGYPADRLVWVAGKVEDTIPRTVPAQIALLRLDTDWYESTRHELEHLFPLLADGGVLILDDYGHWAGARAASDEYLAACGQRLLLHRIDYSGRMATVRRG